MYVRSRVARPIPWDPARFGIRSRAQIRRDLREVVAGSLRRDRFQFGLTSAGLLRADLALPAYAGLVPEDGRAPIFNLFDRDGGGRHYSQRVTRIRARDFRGGRLSYDEHDGTDFVCPVGTPLCAAAPGKVVLIRDRWLRGGLTVAVDHGSGVVTQYTHCSEVLVPIGTRVQRGDEVALSGSSGIDMTQFFPWVPPHVHFMVWVEGRPVDPFPRAGDAPRPGVWTHPSSPVPSGPIEGDETELTSDVDSLALTSLVQNCTDPQIRREMEEVTSEDSLAALVEDALHHDRWAWPEHCHCVMVRRPSSKAHTIRMSLPLPASQYRGAYFADTFFTRPS